MRKYSSNAASLINNVNSYNYIIIYDPKLKDIIIERFNYKNIYIYYVDCESYDFIFLYNKILFCLYQWTAYICFKKLNNKQIFKIMDSALELKLQKQAIKLYQETALTPEKLLDMYKISVNALERITPLVKVMFDQEKHLQKILLEKTEEIKTLKLYKKNV